MKNFTLLLLLLIGAALAGCKVPGSNMGSNAGSTQRGSDTGTANSGAAPSSDPRQDVINASKKFTQRDSFTAKMESTGAKDVRIELSYIAPDRYHIVNPGSAEMIVIGKETYVKANGKWSKIPVNLGESIPNIRDSFTEEALKSLKNVEYTGEDTVDGKNALVYKYTGDASGKSGNYTSKLWVGKINGLPLKMEVEYTDGPLKRMTTVYDYESRVTIEPPAGI